MSIDKTIRNTKLLGAEYFEIKKYIENQFKDGMNWDNYGEWHIDHIQPLVLANNIQELIELCHYSNLQPLWAKDNLKKKDKIINTQLRLVI